MTCYQIKSIEFLTQLPKNNFEGDPDMNRRLQSEWRGDIVECQSIAEDHLDELLDFIEDNSGCLVSSVYVKCLDSVPAGTQNHIIRKFASKSDNYPKGWVWFRSACLIDN
jgi:hypothetical protein